MRSAMPAVLLLVSLLSAAPAAAQPLLPAGPEIPLDGIPIYSPDGRLLVGSTVPEAPGSRSFDVVIRFYLPDGRSPLGPEMRVHTGRAGDQILADVAFAADGSFAVLWTHHQAPGTRQVYWRSFGPDGTPLGPEARAHGPIERDHFAGQIAATPGGGWLLTWEAFSEVVRDPFEGELPLYHLVARRFRADGSARTAAFRLTTGGARDEPEIKDLAVAPDGSALLVFSYYEGENFFEVGAYRIGEDTPLGFVQLSPDPSLWEDFPAVEARADGGFAAVWWDGLLGGIALRGIGPDDSTEEPVLLVPAADLGIGSLATARLPGGRLLVVWGEGPGDQVSEGIFGRIFTLRGAPLSERFRIHLSPMRGIRVLRGIAVRHDGSALVSWGEGSSGRGRRLETGCTPTFVSLCLQGERFRVDGNWAANGTTGLAQVVHLTPDTGYLWFFNSINPELLVKVLDARAVNGHYWAFFGAVTNVAYTVAVTDTATGVQKFYRNRAGRQASVADLGAFPEAPGAAALETAREAALTDAPAASQRAEPLFLPRAGCAAGGPTLCLLGGRFEVEVAWQDFAGGTGMGQAFPLPSPEAGAFWFFQDSNLELLVKILDGRPLNGHFWLFYGALSNVGYTLRVLDTETGAVRTYTNPPGRLASFADTAAF